MVGTMFAGCQTTVDATISLDINPSLELTINSQDQVIDIAGFNDDGTELVLTLDDYKWQPLEDVLEMITQYCIDQGLITADDNLVYSTIDCSATQRKAQIQEKIQSTIRTYAGTKSITLPEGYINFGQYVRTNTRLAKALKMSTGKYTYLVTKYGEITHGEYTTLDSFLNAMKNQSMMQIMTYVNTHLAAGQD